MSFHHVLRRASGEACNLAKQKGDTKDGLIGLISLQGASCISVTSVVAKYWSPSFLLLKICVAFTLNTFSRWGAFGVRFRSSCKQSSCKYTSVMCIGRLDVNMISWGGPILERASASLLEDRRIRRTCQRGIWAKVWWSFFHNGINFQGIPDLELMLFHILKESPSIMISLIFRSRHIRAPRRMAWSSVSRVETATVAVAEAWIIVPWWSLMMPPMPEVFVWWLNDTSAFSLGMC